MASPFRLLPVSGFGVFGLLVRVLQGVPMEPKTRTRPRAWPLLKGFGNSAYDKSSDENLRMNACVCFAVRRWLQYEYECLWCFAVRNE